MIIQVIIIQQVYVVNKCFTVDIDCLAELKYFFDCSMVRRYNKLYDVYTSPFSDRSTPPTSEAMR